MYLRLVLSINIIHNPHKLDIFNCQQYFPACVEGCESVSGQSGLAAGGLVPGAIYPDGATA